MASLPVTESAFTLARVGIHRGGSWILRGISWQVPAGTCAAILGPNGSGKSTLARILAGHWWPSEGQVRIFCRQFGEVDLQTLRQAIRLVQPAGPYDLSPGLSIHQVVMTGFFSSLDLYQTPTATQKKQAMRLLRRFGLEKVKDHAYEIVSSGERVRALIARAMAVKPRLLLLDEPTAGLDLLAREQVLATVQSLLHLQAAPTVVIITHHTEELPPMTQQVLLLSRGRGVACGKPRHVMQKKHLSRAYGCPVTVRRSHGRYHLQVHPKQWRGLLLTA